MESFYNVNPLFKNNSLLTQVNVATHLSMPI